MKKKKKKECNGHSFYWFFKGKAFAQQFIFFNEYSKLT